MNTIIIRKMSETDIPLLKAGFDQQGWDRDLALFQNYFADQVKGERVVVVAEYEGQIAGYATLLNVTKHGPFAAKKWPEIADFNVFIAFQKKGLGNQLLAYCEDLASAFSDTITLGVGLHLGYGPAQRLYIKRGYLPDGSGVWYQNKQLAMQAPCHNDDDLVLYFTKKLRA